MSAALFRKALPILALGAALAFAGGATAENNLAVPPAALAAPPNSGSAELRAALQLLAAQDARVAAIAYRLAVTNVQFCRDTEPEPGVVIQSVFQYSPRLRPVVRAVFSIDDRPAILAVAPDGPGERAGLKANDILLTISGAPVSESALGHTTTDDRPQSYADVDRARSSLEAALKLGPARVSVQRGARVLDVIINPQPGCAYDTQLMPSTSLNASADGHHVFIDTALVAYAADDNDLALVLGHELAHDVLHHREQLDRQGFARNLIGNLGSSRQSLIKAESQADYVGLYLTARAGYDISGAGAFWRKLAHDHGDPWYDHYDHPSAAARSRALDAAREEIAGKIKAGAPLIPNVGDGAN